MLHHNPLLHRSFCLFIGFLLFKQYQVLFRLFFLILIHLHIFFICHRIIILWWFLRHVWFIHFLGLILCRIVINALYFEEPLLSVAIVFFLKTFKTFSLFVHFETFSLFQGNIFLAFDQFLFAMNTGDLRYEFLLSLRLFAFISDL